MQEVNCATSTSDSNSEPSPKASPATQVLTADTAAATIGIKGAGDFKTALAKAQKDAASKAKAHGHASDTRMRSCSDHGYRYGGNGPSGNQVSSAASGDFINSALEKAHYFEMELARAQGKAVLKQYYYKS